LKQELVEMRDKAIHLGFQMVWDLPVPYSAINPASVEIENVENQAKGAGRAWLYVEPDGDVLPGQGINKVLGNLFSDTWESVWKNRE
jgi:MoaA/NifB/PqqE/SkfB family radical SAM enzyme